MTLKRITLIILSASIGVWLLFQYLRDDYQPQLPLLAQGKWYGKDNGQALTPSMGWSSWNAFHLDINQDKIYGIADAMVSLGLRDLGYDQLNIDDGWWLKRRISDGRLIIRTDRFPDAIGLNGENSFKPITEHLHQMGLRVGIYSDTGRNSCAQIWDKDNANLPEGNAQEREIGTLDHTVKDIDLFFNQWGFDFLKLDSCGLRHFSSKNLFLEGRYGHYKSLPMASDAFVQQRYKQIADVIDNLPLKATFSVCVWGQAGVNHWGGEVGNLWRTSADIEPSWHSMLFNYESAVNLELYAGPSRWNDPDMLYVGKGDFDQSKKEQARSHFSLWSMLAAPLILGSDLRSASEAQLDIISNAKVIAINQDPAGHQASRIFHSTDYDVLLKTLSADGGPYTARKALLFLNRLNKPQTITLALDNTHIQNNENLTIHDVWKNLFIESSDIISLQVPAKGVRLLILAGDHITSNTRYLTELPGLIHVHQRHNGIVRILQTDSQSIKVQPNTMLQMKVSPKMTSFSSTVVVNNNTAVEGLSRFSVYGDGDLLWQSAWLSKENTQDDFQLNLQGIDLLELVMESQGSYDELTGSWLNPMLSFTE